MKFMIIRTKQHTSKIQLCDIYYVKSHPTKPHYVEVVTEKKTYDVLEKLQNIERKYPDCFMRCHRNCLVNPSNITEIHVQDRKIILGDKGEHHVHFARRRYQDLVAHWLNKGEIEDGTICIGR
ncbi:LytR/AlgR family response regulator transcription factor [Streptococcus acidominimus]|uniref:LytTR family transcriptional regulator n=1 Tax=Streptococcus acidominimus TaxID=1326 RepID=A0A1Q8EBJ6_STRAI|nr:LytTR family DNA-binding domain-containing protein [Streptococcus acidominimus]MBF0848443.1 LytTR family transcriptional regulator DNA-binding domain-containing protein [Streptococcus danieliae]MBF0818202.1 LytTR family transcriptional regulator DNA-binding domain-containing protein [Streptococcus acidominimus]MBF0838519.1 LytTR family transcriptional regulator DNA-binding domain-containing protein [Streptococcus acidominimus]OLF49160.1 hypothetical protein BU200_08815 [Streptococcus acidomi